MTHVLGRVLLRKDQAEKLVQDAILRIPLTQFRKYIKAKACIGNLIWVQEPYWDFPRARRGYNTHGGVHVLPLRPSQALSQAKTGMRQMDGSRLKRAHSRATLEITVYDAESGEITCKVHMQQIDEFVKARTVA